ncbi:MAG: hypothetical protein M3250_09315 [Thermoproteota archaeon]|nr:hypothetical protein [Thermoproteota archaeon]
MLASRYDGESTKGSKLTGLIQKYVFAKNIHIILMLAEKCQDLKKKNNNSKDKH